MEVDHARSGKQGAGGCEVFLREDSVGGIDAIELSILTRPAFVEEKTTSFSPPPYR